MRNLIKTLPVIAFLTILLILPTSLHAAEITINHYYPSRSGDYDQLRLFPQTSNLSDPCTIGSLYVNSGNSLQYCYNAGGVGSWGSVSDTWTQNGDDIYLYDTALKVGIGTKTPEFKLSLNNDAGIIAQGTFADGALLPDLGGGTRLIWYPRKAAFRAGNVSGYQWDDTHIGIYSAALGKDSTANGAYSMVGGGESNRASGQYSNIIGGQNNQATGDYSAVIGGSNNTATAQYAIITGGALNSVIANYATVLGGQSNQAQSIYSVVGGGLNNIVNAPYSNINAGRDNRISATNGYSVIGGGFHNQVNHDFSVISGGRDNTANNPYTGIGGGQNNTAGITTSGSYARVSGGQNNSANTDYSTVGGGLSNRAMGALGYDTVTGGLQNTASGSYSTVGGGEKNTASGLYSAVIGGTDNTAAGDYSWVSERNMQLTSAADQTFVWGYSDTPLPLSISASNAFIIAGGTNGGSTWWPNVGIRDLNPNCALEINANGTTDDYLSITAEVPNDVLVIKNNGYIGVRKPTPSVGTYAMQFGNANDAYLSGGGVWTNGSSRKFKENIKPLTLQKAENTFEQLAPVTFNYKTNRQTTAGFVAEDVPEILALNNRESLSSMDIVAVLTKVAQDQQQQIKTQKEKIEKIRNEIKTLQEILSN